MKVKIIPSIIAAGVAAIMGYLYSTIAGEESAVRIAVAVADSVSLFLCLECAIGIDWCNKHHSVNIFATSSLFSVFLIAESICFAVWGNKIEWPIITSSLLVLCYLLILYGIRKTN